MAVAEKPQGVMSLAAVVTNSTPGRLALAAAAAVVITYFIFWGMQALIHAGGSGVVEVTPGLTLDFVRIKQDEQVQQKERQVKKPPPPPEEPPPMEMQNMAQDNPLQPGDMSMGFGGFGDDISVDSGFGGAAAGEGDYLPIVKVAPVYPQRAAQRRIEGYVVVEFTVNTLGAVEDPAVIEAEPPGIFNRAALDAARKFKYKPKVVDGKPVPVPGVRNIIRFELEK